MTSALLSIALVLTPGPVQPKEPVWPLSSSVSVSSAAAISIPGSWSHLTRMKHRGLLGGSTATPTPRKTSDAPHYYQEDTWLSAASFAGFPPPNSVSSTEMSVSSTESSSAATVTPVVADSTDSAPPTLPARELNLTEMVDSIFGWPGAQLVQCESRWNRLAVGAAGERGLLQIHPVHIPLINRMGYSWDDMFLVEPNLRVGVEIRRVQGLRAWTCWKG